MRIEKEIGGGPDCVYIYYNPNDKKLASLEGLDRWECKIGFSSVDPIKRINDQGWATSMAKEPVIGLLIRTDNGYFVESKIHKTLYQYRVNNSGGDEWFLTNPTEVEKIFLDDISLPFRCLNTYCEYEISKTGLGEVSNLHRKKINLTQEKLRCKVGVTRDTLWRFFSGDSTIAIGTVMRVLDALGLEMILKSKLPSDEIKIHTSARKAR